MKSPRRLVFQRQTLLPRLSLGLFETGIRLFALHAQAATHGQRLTDSELSQVGATLTILFTQGIIGAQFDGRIRPNTSLARNSLARFHFGLGGAPFRRLLQYPLGRGLQRPRFGLSGGDAVRHHQYHTGMHAHTGALKKSFRHGTNPHPWPPQSIFKAHQWRPTNKTNGIARGWTRSGGLIAILRVVMETSRLASQ